MLLVILRVGCDPHILYEDEVGELGWGWGQSEFEGVSVDEGGAVLRQACHDDGVVLCLFPPPSNLPIHHCPFPNLPIAQFLPVALRRVLVFQLPFHGVDHRFAQSLSAALLLGRKAVEQQGQECGEGPVASVHKLLLHVG